MSKLFKHNRCVFWSLSKSCIYQICLIATLASRSVSEYFRGKYIRFNEVRFLLGKIKMLRYTIWSGWLTFMEKSLFKWVQVIWQNTFKGNKIQGNRYKAPEVAHIYFMTLNQETVSCSEELLNLKTKTKNAFSFCNFINKHTLFLFLCHVNIEFFCFQIRSKNPNVLCQQKHQCSEQSNCLKLLQIFTLLLLKKMWTLPV